MTGPGERKRNLDGLVGRTVEISGMLKHARIYVAPDGIPEQRTTGGVDPLRRDMHLREVNVHAWREVVPVQAAEVAPVPSITAEAEVIQPAETPKPAETPSQPVATTGTEEPARLPKTATPIPFVGLIGFLSLFGAIGLRALRQED